jgi:hypothetical protein
MRSSGQKTCEDWDSVREGRPGGSNYRDPRWVPGANCASAKAQSPDWTAMGRLKSYGAGYETDQTVGLRRGDLHPREADLHKAFQFQSALPEVVV